MPTSAHTRGYTVDIRYVDSHSRFNILQAFLEAGFRRIELAPTWIHVETIQTSRVTWLSTSMEAMDLY